MTTRRQRWTREAHHMHTLCVIDSAQRQGLIDAKTARQLADLSAFYAHNPKAPR